MLVTPFLSFRSLSEELKQSHQHASELESYLGGEIPQLPAEVDNRGLTWKEEREHLQGTIAVNKFSKIISLKLTSECTINFFPSNRH